MDVNRQNLALSVNPGAEIRRRADEQSLLELFTLRCTIIQMHEKLSSSGIDPAFEKVTFENDASILFKHVTARRFRFIYHYHPEIELIYFAEGDGLEFIGDSSQAFKAGHLVLLGSNLPHLWINDAECQYAEACVIQFKAEILGDFLLLLPELARIRLLMESAARGVLFSKLITLEAVPLLTRLGSETDAKRLAYFARNPGGAKPRHAKLQTLC